MLVAFRDLRSRMVQMGLHNSSKAFYAWKVFSLFAMYFTVAAILINGGDTWAAALAASCLLACCWQQSGWLAHDFLHHQVFKDRRLNNAFGFLMGNVAQVRPRSVACFSEDGRLNRTLCVLLGTVAHHL